MDGELPLRPAQRDSSQIGNLVRLYLVRSEEKFLQEHRPFRRTAMASTPEGVAHQERSANPGEAPGKLTFGTSPQAVEVFLDEVVASHTSPRHD